MMDTVSLGGPVGTVIGGKYKLTKLLGEGGMGQVYAAEHTVVGRQVAIKVLHPQFNDSPEVAERFLREARAAGAIDHPGIIDVLDADRDESGTLYMVMEMLEGESLGQLLQRKGRLGPTETLQILRQVLAALQCAHEHGVIHRDLKPDNIFLATGHGGERTARLLDFGISRIVTEDEEAMRLTRTGAVMGTPYYMAPEQARGEKDVDHRADIWALGVMAYQMLSAVRPYRGDSYNAVMIAIAVEPVPNLLENHPHIDSGLARFVQRALAKEPNDRYATVADMARALEEAAAQITTIESDETLYDAPAPDTPKPTPTDEAITTPRAADANDEPTVEADPPPTTPADISTDLSPASAAVAGGFWRRAAALAVDGLVFTLLIGAPLDALVPDSDAVKVKVTPNAAAGSEAKPPKIPEVSVSSVNITDKGVHVAGADGDRVRIDKSGIHIREGDGEEVHIDNDGILVRDADGKTTHIGGLNLNLKPTLATTVKIELWIVYCTLFLMFFGATPGKMVLGLKVVQVHPTKERMPLITALIRSVFFVVSALALGLGCLWCLFDGQRRTWHDRVAKTLVVRSES